MEDAWKDIDSIVEDQLALQIEIAFDRHHAFLVDNGLPSCKQVVDLGTGNGMFLNRLAKHHPDLQFIGIDKRSHLLDRGKSHSPQNIKWELLDAISDNYSDIISKTDGVLMRYLLLHVPNARELLSIWKSHLKPGSKIWVIDVDLSHFQCIPEHPTFYLLKNLVGDFCSQHSIDTFAGQKLGEIFHELGFKNVLHCSDHFTSKNVRKDLFIKFLTQEALLYGHLLGLNSDDEKIKTIINFLNNDLDTGKVDIDYGMILWSAEA